MKHHDERSADADAGGCDAAPGPLAGAMIEAAIELASEPSPPRLTPAERACLAEFRARNRRQLAARPPEPARRPHRLSVALLVAPWLLFGVTAGLVFTAVHALVTG